MRKATFAVGLNFLIVGLMWPFFPPPSVEWAADFLVKLGAAYMAIGILGVVFVHMIEGRKS